MKILIDFCSTIGPFYFAIFGLVCIGYVLFIPLFNIHKNVKQLHVNNLHNYHKTTGVISNYEQITEVKKIDKQQETSIIKYLPIIQYEYNGKINLITYNKPFFKEIIPTIGTQVTIYIDEASSLPLMKYEDIYFNEIKSAKITAIVMTIIISILTMILITLSLI